MNLDADNEEQRALLLDDVEQQIESLIDGDALTRDSCSATLLAMRDVPRHLFVPEEMRGLAYANQALPIGYDQTISQPLVVAVMTAALGLAKHDRVLEVGTGCGYQTAVLSRLAGFVDSIEIVADLQVKARKTLAGLGIENVAFRVGDGRKGWPEAAPFDAILVAAASESVPSALIDQLAPGGRMILPLGNALRQDLVLITKSDDGSLNERELLPVRFVPLVDGGGAG